MERLTQMGNPGLGYCWTKLAFSDVAIMEDMIIDRLGAYEDTGLTPEEIISIHKENAELKELLKLAVNELKRCADRCGECYGCKNLDLTKNECMCKECKLLCDTFDNNMWQWQHADKLKELGVEV